MIRCFGGAELDRFQSLITTRLGLQFDEGKRACLAGILESRLDANGRMRPSSYFESLADPSSRQELRALAAALTVTETYFFRGPDQMRAIVESALAARVRARASIRRLAILSAGCASGEEPYSLAILLREHYPDLLNWEIQILGLDMNPAMLAKAHAGRYCAWSLRETSAELRARHFRENGNDFLLDPGIRTMVTFEERNLAREEVGPLAIENDFDLILCRNMIMYLAPDAARHAVAQLTRALAPGGYLFLGYAETLRGLSQDYHLCHTHNTFYYQKRRTVDATPEQEAGASLSFTTSPPAAWLDSIRLAAQRINELSRSSAANGSRMEPGPAPPPRASGGAENILDLVTPPSVKAPPDADAQLLQAVVLINSGDLQAAEAVCRNVLLVDELNAGAHYLAALCRERAGDLPAAMEQDRVAIYLDHTFAMPHLHLGCLEKRAGNLVGARRELQESEILLLREDAPRILLFGDGFPREALIEFSRAEFRACGGVS